MAELIGTPIGDGFASLSADGNGGGILTINREQAQVYFRELVLKKTSVFENTLGFYTFLPVGRRGELEIKKMKGFSKGLWQAAKDCEWNPKGKTYFGTDSIRTCPIEMMLSECFDGFKECLEFIKRGDNAHYNFLATPEGQQLWGAMLTMLYDQKDDDASDIIHYSNHPNVILSNTEGYWESGTTSRAVWTDWHQQQTDIECDGLLTQVDVMKAEGLPQMNVDLGSYNQITKKYEGSAMELFERMVDAMPTNMARAHKNNGQAASGLMFKVSKAIFSKYRAELREFTKYFDESYKLLINRSTGEFADIFKALRYEGIPVVCMDEWDDFDKMTGIQNPRALLTIAGNALVGVENAPLPNLASNVGVAVQVSPLLREKGRTDILQRIEIGMGWLSPDFIVNASATYLPNT